MVWASPEISIKTCLCFILSPSAILALTFNPKYSARTVVSSIPAATPSSLANNYLLSPFKFGGIIAAAVTSPCPMSSASICLSFSSRIFRGTNIPYCCVYTLKCLLFSSRYGIVKINRQRILCVYAIAVKLFRAWLRSCFPYYTLREDSWRKMVMNCSFSQAAKLTKCFKKSSTMFTSVRQYLGMKTLMA